MSKSIEQMLQLLDSESARLMLVDMGDPDKRTPAFYNAVAKLLERHKFTISKVIPDQDVLGDLALALPPVTSEDDYITH